MSNTIQIKRSTNSGSTPTTLAAGELAVNTADKTLFVGDGSNVVELIGSSLTDINGLTPSNNYFIVGNGSEFVAEPPTDARTSLGLLALATKNNVNLASSEVTGILTVDHGGTGVNTVREDAILKGNNANALIASGLSIDSNDKLNLAEDGIAFDQYGTDPTSSYGAGTMFYSSGGSLKFSTDGTILKQIAYTSDITKTTVSGNGVVSTAGSPLTGGQATETFDINAVSTNDANSIVYRDGSGNFAAGTITASLTGNASTATKWETGRTISLTGDVTGTSGTFDGSGNLSFATTIAANSVELGTNTTGNYVATVTGTANEITVSGSGSESAAVTIGLPNDVTITNDLTVSNDLTVTGNLTVSGTTTTVDTTNLNVSDTLVVLNQGLTAGNTSDIGFIFERGSTGDNAAIIWDESLDTFTLGTTTATGASAGDITVTKGTLVADLTGDVTGDLTGNADTATTATKWATARTITLGGDLTGNVSIDGSANVTLTATVAANSVALGTDTTGNYVESISTGTGLNSIGGTGESANVTISLSHLGIENLSDPNADRVIFWDDSAGSTAWLTLGSNLTISGTTLNATDTTYSEGTGLVLTGTTFSIDSTVLTSSSTIDGGTF